MAKRFTDTSIWEEDWFIEMPQDYRIFWFYVKDMCDHAGIWKPNVLTFNRLYGCSISIKEAFNFFNKDKERIIVLKNGRWFLVGFLPFQYGLVLNVQSRMHNSIINLLNLNGVKLTSIRPLLEVKDRVKDKDKDKDIKKGVVGENKNGPPPKYCFDCGGYFKEQAFEKHLHLCRKKVVV